MIVGLGVDITDVLRFKRMVSEKAFLKKIFTLSELEDGFKRGASAYMSFAARWAAKEAFGKALGTGLKGFNLKDVSVETGQDGEPGIRLLGTALAAFKKKGAKKLHVSLTHEKYTACAVVILEK